jgi:diguanylate cyclase
MNSFQKQIDKNRLAFEKEFPSIFEKDPSPGLLYIDLNGLSRVNKLDDLHAAGDKYLHDVAQALRKELRAGDEIYRIGGDEIAVVLRNVTLEQIEKIIERYRIRGLEGVEHANLPAETYPGVSVGGAIKQPGDRSHEDMIKRADKHSEEEKQAFYQDIERRTGKNVRR